ncbi:hypothetical protein [Actinokineospora enzanensis]|nr:hypothetical protein [Actinokineospora enzanensis]
MDTVEPADLACSTRAMSGDRVLTRRRHVDFLLLAGGCCPR